MLEVKPILSTFLRHKSSSILTILQISITFAVVVNSISIINQRLAKIDRESGLAETQIISMNVNPYGNDYDLEQNYRGDIELLRNTPGVIDATLVNQMPMSGSGSSSSIATSQKNFESGENFNAGFYRSDSHLLNTFGVKLKTGRNFHEEEIVYTEVPLKASGVLITQSLSKKLFPDGDALGQSLFFGGMETPVIGVIEKMVGPWVESSIFEDNIVMPIIGLSRNSKKLVIRAEDSQINELLGSVEKLLLKRNPNRVITQIRSLNETKNDSYSNDTAMTKVLWTVIGLLVLVTALGIVGIVSFNISQRTKQIGTRRALGAKKSDILRYFVTENILITSLGVILGSLITIGLNIYLIQTFEMTPIEWLYFPVGILVMLLTGILSVWYPAIKASKVSPAVATQSI